MREKDVVRWRFQFKVSFVAFESVHEAVAASRFLDHGVGGDVASRLHFDASLFVEFAPKPAVAESDSYWRSREKEEALN